MLGEMVAYHRYMVEILLFVVVLNLILPMLLKKDMTKMVFWSRIGYFAFWMLWSTNIFAGLMVFMFVGREFTHSVLTMIGASIILGILDGYRAIKSRRLWNQGLDANKFSFFVILAEIAIILAVTLLSI